MKIEKDRILCCCQSIETLMLFDLLPSTNLHARECLMQDELGPSLILAQEQSAGRGRLGRSFHSPADAGIYMTLVLPLSQIQSPEELTVRAGVALCEALEKQFPTLHPSIKWVNDIYANEKKLAGILVEGVFSAKGTPYAIVGVGINCEEGALPKELSDIATDIRTACGKSVDQTALIIAFVNGFFDALTRDFPAVINIYRSHSLLLGKKLTVLPHAAAPYCATAQDIDALGRLIVRLDDGTLRTLSSADVSVRKLVIT